MAHESHSHRTIRDAVLETFDPAEAVAYSAVYEAIRGLRPFRATSVLMAVLADVMRIAEDDAGRLPPHQPEPIRRDG